MRRCECRVVGSQHEALVRRLREEAAGLSQIEGVAAVIDPGEAPGES